MKQSGRKNEITISSNMKLKHVNSNGEIVLASNVNVIDLFILKSCESQAYKQIMCYF